MNERRQDCELLRAFVRQGDQPAFAAVARQHLDLVYATALRKLEDPGAAEEVAQNVFAALARKAWQFGPDDSLPAWLYRTTLLEAKTWLRGELRRRRRDQTAAELGTTMKTPDEQPALRALVPLLDEALLSLREKERTALLLRYYESQSLRDVGATLGISEDAACKRVGTALDSLSSFFQRRGFKTATTAAAAAALQHTAVAAPAAVAASITQTALQAVSPGIAGLAALLSRLASLTKVQTTALCLVLAVAPVSWQRHQTLEARTDAAAAQLAVEAVRAQQEELASEEVRLRAESSRLDGALAQATTQTQALARTRQTIRQNDALNARIRGLLTADDYYWSDDPDLVRLPKSVVKDLNPLRAVDTRGNIRDWGVELLDMTPTARRQVGAAVRAYSEALGQLIATQAYETNHLPDELVDWASRPHKSIWVPPLGADTQTLMANLLGQLQQVLGDERARLLLGDAAEGKFASSVWIGAHGDFSKGALVSVFIYTNPFDTSSLMVNELVDSRGGGRGESRNQVGLWLPEAITHRFFDSWLAQMGLTNIPKSLVP
jgi:RNA polymerase sigma factor (sigma-70 family)